MDHDAFDAVLQPLGLANSSGRAVLIAFLESAAIALLRMYISGRTWPHLETYQVLTVTLDPRVKPANKNTSLEPRGYWDSPSEAQADRGWRGLVSTPIWYHAAKLADAGQSAEPDFERMLADLPDPPAGIVSSPAATNPTDD